MTNLVTIGDNAFGNAWGTCPALKSIGEVPELETIGSGAFYGCEELETIGALRSVTEIGTDAFKNCKNLALRVLPNSYAENYAKSNNIKYTYIED